MGEGVGCLNIKGNYGIQIIMSEKKNRVDIGQMLQNADPDSGLNCLPFSLHSFFFTQSGPSYSKHC